MEDDVAAFQCVKCNEWYTELELYDKRFRDEPCLNCGTYEVRERKDFVVEACDYCGWMFFNDSNKKFPVCFIEDRDEEKYRLCGSCREQLHGRFKYVK